MRCMWPSLHKVGRQAELPERARELRPYRQPLDRNMIIYIFSLKDHIGCWMESEVGMCERVVLTE